MRQALNHREDSCTVEHASTTCGWCETHAMTPYMQLYLFSSFYYHTLASLASRTLGSIILPLTGRKPKSWLTGTLRYQDPGHPASLPDSQPAEAGRLAGAGLERALGRADPGPVDLV